MPTSSSRGADRKLAALLDRFGRTYAEQAGIRLRDKPSPLFQLLVLSMLLSARISADVAVAAARELFAAGYRTPERMRKATWQQRVDALGRGHYRRYDERTSTMLGETADLLLEKWRGDLRKIHSDDDPDRLRERLVEFKGIGPAGAKALGLPTTPAALARRVSPDDFTHLASALVHISVHPKAAADLQN